MFFTKLWHLKKRNLECESSNSSSSNAFSVLSNMEIMARASLMGVDIPSDNFETIDLLKELEKSRDNLVEKNVSVNDVPLVVVHDNGVRTPMCLTWMNDADLDASFTVVQSRSSRKSGKNGDVVVSRPVTRSQKKKDMPTHNPGRPIRHRSIPVRLK